MTKLKKPATGSAIMPPPVGNHNRISRLGRELRREANGRGVDVRNAAKREKR